MNEFLAALGIKKVALLAGLVGGIVSLRFFEGLTNSGKAMTAIGGAAFANYLTTPVVSFFKVSPGDFDGGVGFALGLFGMSVAAAAVKMIRETDWSRFIPGGVK